MLSFVRPFLGFGLALAVAHLGLAAETTRFSKSLPPADRADVGLTQLNSDQLAVLDALVRHDVATWDFVTKNPRPTRFSDRLSATERHNAGLDLLDAAQLSRLDVAVERLMPAAPRGSYAATATARSSSAVVSSLKINRTPEIHGSMSFTVGVGSHGYSEIGGSMVLTYDDPASGFGLAIGYSEFHTKGGYGFGRRGGCFGGYDPYYPSYPWW